MIMSRNRIILFLLLILGCGQALLARDSRKVDYELGLGFNLGATTPMGLPAEVRKIDSYKPTVNLSIAAQAIYRLSPKWGVGLGLIFENKGMKTGIRVRNYHLSMNIQDGTEEGSKTGYYTGKIRNTTRMSYITVPVNAVFRPADKWSLEFGPYFSYAIDRVFTGKVSEGQLHETPLHPAIGVNKADYDYSDDMRRFDVGLGFGASRAIYRNLAVKARLSWGLRSVLNPDTRKIDMNTYNVFLNIGLSYNI